ncbi:MAG: (2Fe-2S)-binding protein, partial [Qingshengfaniella sp.]
DILLDGLPVSCREGVPLTEVLMARAPAWRASHRLGRPRGLFCGMGLCFECVVEVDGIWARACLEQVRAGMSVRTAQAEEAGT